MKQYLLSVVTPTGGTPPPPEVLGPIMQRVAALNQELKDAGAWVFSGGLNAPSTATVLHPQGDDVLLTDGPFAEGKEYLGDFSIILAAALDAALGWGRRLTRAIGLPIEVRPFVDEAGD
ncbi:MAG: YciI family protein [Candidatus Limnocylindrales bacterium]